jgi:hypothetical protein
MNIEKFLEVYNESRNGANEFYRHFFVASFHYSDGIRACAETGLYWLIDILATEAPAQMRKAGQTLATVSLIVKGGKAKLVLSGSGDVVFWTKKISYTDMADGTWVFMLADEETRRALILVTEY